MNVYHEGPAVIRNAPDNQSVWVLCPYGHIQEFIPIKEWAGSNLEAKATWTVRCCGTILAKEVAHGR